MQPDCARHLSLAALETGLKALAAPPARGRVSLIVCRCSDGSRATPERLVLTPEEGVPGDAWNRRLPLDPGMQLAVMRHDVALLIANGQPLTLFGDNLFVDFDLSAGQLPAGTRLRVGDSVVEVSPKAHNGCQKFHGRFGSDAHRFVQAKATRHLNLRGIYWRVVEEGEVAVGAPIERLPE